MRKWLLHFCLSLGLVSLLGCPRTKAVVLTDEAARSRIAATGVRLPRSATGLYYAFQPQFADYIDTWISFSASEGDCMTVAESVARFKSVRPAFVPGTRSSQKQVMVGPAYDHPELATPWRDLSSVTNGSMFETQGLFVLVDRDKNRVYIAMRDIRARY